MTTGDLEEGNGRHEQSDAGGGRIAVAVLCGGIGAALCAGSAWGTQTTSFSWLEDGVNGIFNSRPFIPQVTQGMSTASEQCWAYLDQYPTNFDWTNNTMWLNNPSVPIISGNWTEQLTLQTPWWQPNQDLGQHTFTCNSVGQPYQWAYFGSQPASRTYFFSTVNSSYWNWLDGGLNAQGYMGI